MGVIVFTGGGTGGHVYPGLAVIQTLKSRWQGDFVWIGSKDGMENGIVASAGIKFYGIPSGKLRRYFSLQNFFDIFKILAGIFAAFFILLRIRPLLVFSKGGYVAVPPVLAAKLLGIPVLIHESDFDPGLATRLTAPFAWKILIPYQESSSLYSSKLQPRLVVTGNPVRGDILNGSAEKGREILGIDAGRKILLVFGGSQGARELNNLVNTVLKELLIHCDVVHQTGSAEFKPSDVPGYHPFAYLREELPDILAAADLVVSRAGAGSLWEIAAAGKPSLIIPLRGGGTRGDQVRNAHHFEDRGMAKALFDETIEPEVFLKAVQDLFDPEAAASLKQMIREIAGKNAAQQITDIILDALPQGAIS